LLNILKIVLEDGDSSDLIIAIVITKIAEKLK
jgi:hypothetical protein